MVEKNIRLLIVTPELAPTFGGGIVTFYQQLLPALERCGIDLTVLVGSHLHQPGGQWQIDGIQAFGLEPVLFQRTIAKFSHWTAMPEIQMQLAAAHALHNQAQQYGEFDLIEVADWGLLGAAWLASADANKVIVQCHGSVGQISQRDPRKGAFAFEFVQARLEKNLFERGAAVWSYAPDNANSWLQDAKLEVQYLAPAITVPEIPNLDYANKKGFVVFARVQRWKGPETLCEAVAKVDYAENITWFGRCVDDPESGQPMTTTLQQKFPQVWGSRIQSLPTVSPAIVLEKMRAARAVLVPSSWDVFNFTVVEAMANACVVIASRGAGASHLIEHGVNGFVFPVDDANALAKILQAVAQLDPLQLQTIGDNARATITQTLDPVAVANKRRLAYRELLDAPSIEAAPQWLHDAVVARSASLPSWDFFRMYPIRPMLREIVSRIFKRLLRR